jgi:hypothetical protein
MAGRNRLKQSFATRCEPMLWQVFQQPRLAFRLERLAQRVKRGLIARKPLPLGQEFTHPQTDGFADIEASCRSF